MHTISCANRQIDIPTASQKVRHTKSEANGQHNKVSLLNKPNLCVQHIKKQIPIVVDVVATTVVAVATGLGSIVGVVVIVVTGGIGSIVGADVGYLLEIVDRSISRVRFGLFWPHCLWSCIFASSAARFRISLATLSIGIKS